MDHSLDEKVNLIVIDMDASCGMVEFPTTISGQQYQDALLLDPLPPGEVLGYSAALVVLFPPSLRWIIWGERSPDIMALAFADGFPDLSVEAIVGSDVCLFSAEDAMDISTPAWSDRGARRPSLKSYSAITATAVCTSTVRRPGRLTSHAD
jgi:hypothetical protein